MSSVDPLRAVIGNSNNSGVWAILPNKAAGATGDSSRHVAACRVVLYGVPNGPLGGASAFGGVRRVPDQPSWLAGGSSKRK